MVSLGPHLQNHQKNGIVLEPAHPELRDLFRLVFQVNVWNLACSKVEWKLCQQILASFVLKFLQESQPKSAWQNKLVVCWPWSQSHAINLSNRVPCKCLCPRLVDGFSSRNRLIHDKRRTKRDAKFKMGSKYFKNLRLKYGPVDTTTVLKVRLSASIPVAQPNRFVQIDDLRNLIWPNATSPFAPCGDVNMY